jgi:Na+/melibiose symporter-like transporter
MKKNRIKEPGGYSLLKQIGWSGRAISLACNYIIIGQATYFCTNLLKLDPVLIGMLFLVSRIFDAAVDPIYGYVVERTKTRFGKARPYELSVLGLWAFTVLLFACPDIGNTGKYVWIFITFTLINAGCTSILSTTESIYLSRAFTSDKARVKTMSFNGVITMLGAMVVSVIFPGLMATMGTTRAGWVPLTLIFAIPLAIIGLLRLILVKEVEDITSTDGNKTTVKEFVRAFTCNRYAALFVIAMMLVSALSQLSSNVNAYYFAEIIGDLGQMGILGVLGVATLPLLMFFPLILKKVTKSQLLIAGFIAGTAGYIIRMFAGTNIGVIIIGTLISGLAVLAPSYLGAVMNVDQMDYSEHKTGKRVEGVFGTVTTFTMNLGQGLASMMIGLVMGMAGYNANLETQSDSALGSIVALFSWIPAILCVIVIIFMLFYKKIDMELPQIHKELSERAGSDVS